MRHLSIPEEHECVRSRQLEQLVLAVETLSECVSVFKLSRSICVVARLYTVLVEPIVAVVMALLIGENPPAQVGSVADPRLATRVLSQSMKACRAPSLQFFLQNREQGFQKTRGTVVVYPPSDDKTS